MNINKLTTLAAVLLATTSVSVQAQEKPALKRVQKPVAAALKVTASKPAVVAEVKSAGLLNRLTGRYGRSYGSTGRGYGAFGNSRYGVGRGGYGYSGRPSYAPYSGYRSNGYRSNGFRSNGYRSNGYQGGFTPRYPSRGFSGYSRGY